MVNEIFQLLRLILLSTVFVFLHKVMRKINMKENTKKGRLFFIRIKLNSNIKERSLMMLFIWVNEKCSLVLFAVCVSKWNLFR